MPKIIHNTAGGGGGGTDDQVAAEVPVATSPFTGHLGTADDDVQTALETLDALDIGGTDKLDDATWNGFVDKSDSEITFTDSDRTFEIDTVTGVSDFEVYIEGVKYDTAGDTLQISDVDGIHVIYFDTLSSTVELVETVNPTDAQMDTIIRTKCLVSIVYWNSTDGEAIYVGEERHGIIMSTVTHAYLHFIEGLRYVFGLSPSGFNISDGDDNEDAQFGIDVGAVSDEDLYASISAVGPTTGLPIYYMIGFGSLWTKLVNPGFSVDTYDGTNLTYLFWNEYTSVSGWKKTEMSSGNYVLCHVFATTEKDTPMIAIVGQASYNNKPSAYEGAQTEMLSLVLSDLPLPEIKPIASVLFYITGTNDVRSRVALNEEGDTFIDWRSDSINRSVSSVSEHNLLSGLQGGSAADYYHLTSAQHGDLTDGTDTILHTHSHTILEDIGVDDHHAQVHTILSHDTDATGLELTELTDGSETTLHSHAGGGGDVVGPASATDHAVARYDTTTGKLIQDSDVLIGDTGTVNVPATAHLWAGYLHAYVYTQTVGLTVTGDITMGSGSNIDMNAGNIDLATGATIATVTGAELNTLTDGSDASSLHTHTNFSTGFDGYVPGPVSPSGDFLKDDGTWDTPAGGSGDVTGPGNFVTPRTIPVFSDTSGYDIAETTAEIDVSGNLTINGNIIVTGLVDGYDVSVMGGKLSGIENFAEKNTASNTGTGIGIYGGKSLSNLMFKALKDDGAGTMDIALSGDSLSIEFAVSASSIDTAQLAPNSVDNTILDDMPLLTIKGNDTGGTANPKDLTVAEVNAMLGAGGGAPIDAEYITASSDSTLSAEHVLVGGYGIELDDGAGTMTLDAVTEDYYALTSASSVTPDHANGPKYEVVAAHDIVFAIPTDHANWVDGQVVEYRIEQDGTGSRDVTFSVDYRTGEIPSMATAQGAGEITYVLMKYHAGDDKMDVVAFMRGYIT